MFVKLFTGPMFSGKTRKLVTDLERYVIAKKHVAWFEPVIDTRGGSHGNYIAQRMIELKESEYVHCFKINTPEEIISVCLEKLSGIRINAIYIDEYHMLDFKRQFFYDYHDSIIREIPLIFSGLINGCDATVLKVAEEVLPFVDEIKKENAICMDCGKSANYYSYIGKWSPDNQIDNGKNYKCLCHDCFMKLTKKPINIENQE